MPPLAALIPIVIVAIAFDAYCLYELARSGARYLPKWAWALVILLVSAPVGGIAYLVAGRQHA
ncbi:MAG: PLDc N-terminal domain-containing protein [Dehalococcoidia bacterium]